MTSPTNTAPAHIWETLQRLLACNKTQLAARLGITTKTLRRWIMDTEAGESPGRNAEATAARLLQQTLEQAQSAVHAQLMINWQAVHSIGGRK